MEERHEREMEIGSGAEVVEIGREYAATVQEHLHAVMAWLSRIEKHGHQPKRLPQD
jgi:hypothetical protein